MFAKERKNRFYHLPKELIIYIYSYDNTYKKKYNKCLNNMLKLFQINRINDRILGELHLYNVYYTCCKKNSINIYGNPSDVSFSKYILKRIKMFGDQVPNENLKHYKLLKCIM
jgi:hypothetical protein